MPQSVRCNLRHRVRLATLLLCALLTSGALLLLGSCQSDEPQGFAQAYQATHRDQLIGGPGALGEVGDWVIENDKIRLVVQNTTFNRGTGLFGGSLIDADLVRPAGEGDPFGGNGRDTFGEAFPAYFLEVIDPQEIVVVDPAEMDRDDIHPDAAVLEVRGDGGEFVTMLRFFNHAMVKAYHPHLLDLLRGEMPDSDGTPLVQFTARYILEPGDRHARLESEMTNRTTGRTLSIPMDFQELLDAFSDFLNGDDDDNGDADGGGLTDFIEAIDFEQLTVPTGWALGFGAMNSLFAPGLGYDIRFGLEDIYANEPVDLPALPGHITDLLATTSTDGISYGFATAPSPQSNFVYNKPEYYGDDVNDFDMLLIFQAAGYGGAFTHEIIGELGPGESFTAVNYFVVGTGDVASVRDEVYKIHDRDTDTVTGRIYHDATGEPAGRHANFFAYELHPDGDGCTPAEPGSNDPGPIIINQAHTNSEGYFEFQLPPGQYCYRTQLPGGPTSEFRSFEVDGTTNIQAPAPATGRIEAMIVDETGSPIPAKMTVVGEYDPIPGLQPRQYLFDLSVGERWRTSESVIFDPDDDSPRRFIENIEFSGADGRAALDVVPGEYTIYFSRGAEYGLTTKDVVVDPGRVTRLNASIERQINPDGYLSGDFHMHAAGSIDSGLDYNDRVISIAAEGVEVVVSSDHNYISDFAPYIFRNNLHPYLRSIVGLELTTMEAGHFNAFPLRQDIASQNRGSVRWQDTPPDEFFESVRKMGAIDEDNTIIQVNHPRDSILGYFNQHNLDPLTARAELPLNIAHAGSEGGFDGDLAAAAALSPSGPSFAYRCPEGESGFCSAFSYDFDAIEIYNGKRLHVVRHFRIPSHDELSDEAIEVLFEDHVTIAQICAHPDVDAAMIADILGEDFDEGDIDIDNCDGEDFDVGDFSPADFEGQILTDLLPAEGAVLCDGDDVAYPGGLDDWYNFLNYGQPGGEYRPYTATANSDSHHYGSPDDPEPGFPKNYFWVGHNDPQKMQPIELVQALQNHHNIATNGPFINMSINDNPIGSTVAVDDGQVTLDLVAKAADWVVGDEGLDYTIVANGEPIVTGHIDIVDGFWSDSVTINLDEHDIHFADGGVRDTWFVFEVEGTNNLFPVSQPAEIPTVPFDQALGAIAEPFGFGAAIEGLAPEEETDIHPFAFTNPIWVIDNADGGRLASINEFAPPNPPVAECSPDPSPSTQIVAGDHRPMQRRLSTESLDLGLHDHSDAELLIKREQGELRDVRALFNHWHEH